MIAPDFEMNEASKGQDGTAAGHFGLRVITSCRRRRWAFGVGVVLDGALAVFRERGYRAASPDELGAAIKRTPDSIDKALDGTTMRFLAVSAAEWRSGMRSARGAAKRADPG